jgi:hypothetical protein
MYYLQMSGYGYRKRICESVTDWFMNRYMPRHTIDLRVVHRGLKRDLVYGWCDFEDDYKRPRAFLIELQSNMGLELYIKTLIHELVHVRQWVFGSLRQKRGKMYYGSTNVEDLDYDDQPHEIEAREQEETLYITYLIETGQMFPRKNRPRHLL